MFEIDERILLLKVFWRRNIFYSLESAGEGGFIVSGLISSLGLGDLSLLGPWVVPKGPNELWEPIPSIETPFSDRNSSRSTY